MLMDFGRNFLHDLTFKSTRTGVSRCLTRRKLYTANIPMILRWPHIIEWPGGPGYDRLSV